MCYDSITKIIRLTDDEITILKEALEERENKCVSFCETVTIEALLEKLD